MGDKDISTWRDWGQRLDTYDFDLVDNAELNRRDVIGKLITGKYSKIEFSRNFLRCAFRDAKLSELTWSRVDYKDTVFIDTEITDSNLGGGSTVSCTFSNCTFFRCSYEDAAIHDCFYQDCTFVDCDFQNSMIRNSQLVNCRFERCTTSNKLFDGCRLFSNIFTETSLDFRAIVDNFGLDSQQLPSSSVREDRSYPDGTEFNFEARGRDLEWTKSLSTFEILKLEYYRASGKLIGGNVVDTAFEPDAWISLVRAPVNLMRLLQDFAEFIFFLYGKNRLSTVFVLKLAILSNLIWRGFADNSMYAQLAQVGSGIYLQCLQSLAELDSIVANWLTENNFKKIIFRSFDDADDDTIEKLAHALSSIVPEATIKILPRNSPVDILFANLSHGHAVFLLTLFFSTKTRIELSRIKARKPNKGKQTRSIKPLVAISLGGAKGNTLKNALSLEGTLPGAMVLRFDVDYNSALVEQIKRTIKAIL